MRESAANKTPPAGSGAAPALAAVYAALFLSAGFYLPFFSVFLANAGFSPEAIGLAVGIPMGVRLFANPVAGVLSDRWGRPRRFLAVLGVGAALCFALMAAAPGAVAIVVLVGLATAFWGPSFPLTDAFGVRLARERGIDYGRARLWGSVSFIAANLALGAALEILPAIAIVWFIAASLVLFAVATMLMPRLEKPAVESEAAPAKFGARIVLGVIAAACVQASHALLYAFGSVHWIAAGISPTMVGFLWAVGVAAEVVVFYFGTIALRRFSPLGLILVGGISSALRFSLMALDPPQALLIPLMITHAFTFTATYLGMVTLVGAHAGASAMGRAQTFASAAVSVAMLCATFAAGPLYARFGAEAFFGSALIGAAGIVIVLLAMLQPQSAGKGGKAREPS